MDAHLRVAHSLHEALYTPDVFDARGVLDWGQQIEEMGRGEEGVGAGDGGVWEGWREVSAGIWEMGHEMPAVLDNRVFPVLVVSGLRDATEREGASFVVVQIPVDVGGVEEAVYSNGRHKMVGDSEVKKKPVVLGQYVSVEHCRVENEEREVVWQMATASDAKGSLPMPLQKMGVPGAVVKDVGLFMDWIDRKRNGRA